MCQYKERRYPKNISVVLNQMVRGLPTTLTRNVPPSVIIDEGSTLEIQSVVKDINCGWYHIYVNHESWGVVLLKPKFKKLKEVLSLFTENSGYKLKKFCEFEWGIPTSPIENLRAMNITIDLD